MKKILLTCTAILFALSASTAQVTTSAGIKVESTYSKYRISGMPGVDSRYGFGAGAGGFVKVEFGDNFALQPELMFNLNRSKLKSDGSANLRHIGVRVPVYAIGQFGVSDGKLFVGAGPYASYGLSNKIKQDGSSSNLYKKHDGGTSMKRFDLGAWAIFGYEFNSGFILNAGYQLGFKDNLKASGSSMKSTAFSLGLGYKF